PHYHARGPLHAPGRGRPAGLGAHHRAHRRRHRWGHARADRPAAHIPRRTAPCTPPFRRGLLEPRCPNPPPRSTDMNRLSPITRRILWAAWAIVPVAVFALHMGAGRDLLARDRAGSHLKAAIAAEQAEDYATAAEEYAAAKNEL